MTYPSVFVGIPPMRGREERLMLAEDILTQAFRETINAFVGAPIDDITKFMVAHSIQQFLHRQFSLRGFSWEMSEIPTIDIVEDADRYHIMTEPGWVEKVDRLLCNQECRRCRKLLVYGERHTPEDCDLVITRDIIES